MYIKVLAAKAPQSSEKLGLIVLSSNCFLKLLSQIVGLIFTSYIFVNS